ncbi:exopolyphosphatase [Rhodococcus sp. SC4]|uniref:acyclic terpene utilization AtuA family protein n=1 Tax=Rhodococcus sp. LB1 TaxID=1807499 RepID=UPI00076A6B32|nr:acyclic terpene utilization AtuA family protein [Rhodococcus sp. LB1]KXF57103.1 exopolyphosphatase [Rhodococcus sp. SC4]KXX56420.1 exopolyphosphatase [Rhodococcus sp. LB1]
MTAPLRIGNVSGFYGDRLSAAREMVEGGDIDVLTGDYLAELTMYILWKSKTAGRPGYASTFLTQMKEVLGTCVERGIKIVVNAGGLDPKGLADALRDLAAEKNVSPAIAYLTGDDLIPRMDELRAAGVDFRNIDTGEVHDESSPTPATANAYLGARGIAHALSGGADIVVCPRVTDASLVVGPAMWKFGWDMEDYDCLAGAVAAGHVIECGAQATGGNYAFFEEIENPIRPGFPIAEMHADGSSVITKHEGTGGMVSVGTVTAQLVYEVGERNYLNTDVILDLGSIELTQEGPDRVRMSGVRGQAPPPTVKVTMNCVGTYNQSMTFAIPGDDVEAKAAVAQAGMLEALGGAEQFDSVDFRLVRSDQLGAAVNELSVAKLVATFSSYDKDKLGRRIFDAAMSLALSSYPGIYFQDEKQQRPTQTGLAWPCLVPQELVTERVVMPDGTTVDFPGSEKKAAEPALLDAGAPRTAEGVEGPTQTVSLGKVFGARSGDKGAHANVGIWGRSDDEYAWLREHLTVEGLLAIFPEASGREILRVELPNLRAVNFLIRGLLGGGAASGGRFDPQAKGLAEFIRSRKVELPVALLEEKNR